MKSNSKDSPLVFDNLQNGAWHYNHNIVEVQKTDENGEVQPSFDYDQVKVWGVPTQREVIKAVIAEKWDVTQEIDLANDNKRFELGLSDDVTLRDKYIAYLNEVAAIKTMVESDFSSYADQLNQ